MKRLFYSFIGLWLAMTTVFAQNENENDTDNEAEDVINVIAYFAKNDTMRYRFTDIEMKIKGTDTTQIHSIAEEFMLVVTDSTSEGYRMEVTPLNYSIEEGGADDDLEMMMAEPLWQLTKDLKCIFTTDELGTIQHIENWREIRDTMKQGIAPIFDSLYVQTPGLDSIMPRQQFESLMMLQLSTEAGIMEGYEELSLLFGMHGKACDMEQKTVSGTSEAGYPTETWINAGYTKQQDEYDLEDDYGIIASTTTTIPADDAIEMAKNALGVVLSAQANNTMSESGVMEELRKEMKDDMTAKVDEVYMYFFNGWPKDCYKVEDIRFAGSEKRSIKEVEWLSRKWQ